MDTLSQFLALHPVSTTLDWRCELSPPWRLVNEGTAYGRAPYHLVTQSEAWLQLPGREKLRLSPGDIVMLPQGSAHILHCGDHNAPLAKALPPTTTALGTLKTQGDGPGTEILCGEFVLDPLISKLLIQSLPQVVHIKTGNNAAHLHLCQLLQILKSETQDEAQGSYIIATHLSSALFSLLIRGWLSENSMPGNILQLLTEPRLFPAVQYFLNNPEKHLPLGELATMCHMSRATFIRLFKRVSGRAPSDLMTDIRLMHASTLLGQPGVSIGAICEKVGYVSEPSFHRLFRQRMGMSPGQFRRKQLSANKR